MQAMIDNASLHSVYIVDEDGMSKIFADLKQTLVLQNDATLIYFSSESNFIFERELEILQKRYPSQFIWNAVREKVIAASTTLQELLEAVINSNTKDRVIFILSGDEELIYIVSNQLWFLGICKNQIKIYFLANQPFLLFRHYPQHSIRSALQTARQAARLPPKQLKRTHTLLSLEHNSHRNHNKPSNQACLVQNHNISLLHNY